MEEDRELSRLYKAINGNKPWIAIGILKVHPELVTRGSTFGDGATILMMAIRKGCSSKYIAKMIEMTPDEGVLRRQDNGGNTILHVVAMVGNIEVAKLLMMKCPTLLLIRNESKDLPIHVAVKQGHLLMTDFLLSVVEQQGYDDPFAGVTSQDIMLSAIDAGMDDVIIALSYNNPDLVKSIDEEDEPLDEPANDAKMKLLEAIASDRYCDVTHILDKHPELSTASLTTSGETPIMVAAAAAAKKVGSSDKFDLVKMLIGRMSDEELAKTDNSGNTVLHTAAMLGSTRLAKKLLKKCHTLLLNQNNSGDTPICVSIKHGHQDMTQYLFDIATEGGHRVPFGGEASVDLVCSAIRAGMYRLAFMLRAHRERLPEEDGSVLEAFAEDPSAFCPNATLPLSCWKAVSETIFGKDLTCQEIIVLNICWKEDYGKASTICKEKIFKEPLLLAVRNGNEYIVDKILHYQPDAINFLDEEDHSIFHLAVMYRHKNIFKLAYQTNVEASRRLLSMPDKKGNNILHLAGNLARQNRLNQSTRVILQMQHELKWFKELENLLLPQDIKLKNYSGKTPLEIFNEQHKKLVTTETQWMTGMAQACSVAAPLIATVAFAAAITVPGGNNSNGLPMFSDHKTFKVFAISDALALFASIACVLSFLSIFTSRYGVDDYLYALPNRLIIGLVSLFISAISLMIAFGTTLFLVFGQENSVILMPIIVFSCAPVILYAILQFPSLLNMIKSTYGRRLLV